MASNALTNLRGRDPGANRQTDAISRLVEPVAKAVMATPIMGAKPPAWIRPPLQNGFVDYGGTLVPLRMHMDALHYVHAQACVIGTAGGAPGVVVTTLPVGFRPSVVVPFVADNTGAHMTVEVWDNGNLAIPAGINPGDVISFSFSFLAEQ